jgi:hypothetical protein
MRVSNRVPPWVTSAARATLSAVAMIALIGCAAPAPSAPPPTARPTPAITPEPRLAEPASVDVVFRRLGAAGLRITANTATSGTNGEPVKQVNATYRGWPLIITQFSSSATLRELTRFDPARRPGRGQAPYRLVGLNIFVEYGPRVTNSPLPATPDDLRREAAEALAAALVAFLGPLQQSSVEPVVLPGQPLGDAGAAPASPIPAKSPSG